MFLIAPSACGIFYWIFGGPYSTTFAIFSCIWGVVFVEYWKRQEIDLAIRWNVKGVGSLKVSRPQYRWDAEIADPKTGEIKKIFPTRKRLLRQLLFLPFAALAGLALGTMLVGIFMAEALLSDVLGDQMDRHWVAHSDPGHRRDIVDHHPDHPVRTDTAPVSIFAVHHLRPDIDCNRAL